MLFIITPNLKLVAYFTETPLPFYDIGLYIYHISKQLSPVIGR